MSDYYFSHLEFKMGSHGGDNIRKTLVKAFGATDPYTPLTSRIWFTLGNYFYVAREQADHKLITWIMLHQ